MSALADRQNPWLGLLAYGESEREFFFGREGEAAELVRLVEDEPLVVLYGVSGLGKTSLLQAGLFPALRKRDFLPVAIRLQTDWQHPYLDYWIEQGSRGDWPTPEYVADVMQRVPLSCQIHYVDLQRAGREAGVKVPESDRPETFFTLWEFFHRVDAQFWSERQRLLTPVLVFDQFEEIFTLGQENEARHERSAAFLQELSDLIYNRPPAGFSQRLERGEIDPAEYSFDRVPLRVVISLREDFLPQLSELRERGFPTLLKAALRIHPLNPQAAREVVERPGEELLEPGVSEQIVRFVANAPPTATSAAPQSGDGPSPASVPHSAPSQSQWIEPALLSVVCRELNAERLRRRLARINADLLTLSQEQILADFYERSLEGIAPPLRYFLEDELLTPGGFRDSRALDDALSRDGIVQPEIDRLIERRLLHYQDRQDGPRRIELTHDLLTRVVRASRQRREEEANQHEATEAALRAEEEARLTAERLAAAEAERERETRAREEAERLQLQAEQARALAERAQRRARWLAAAAALIAIVAIAIAFFAHQQSLQLQVEKQKVETEKERAETGQRAAKTAKEKAVAARKSADGLINYMQYDLRDTLGKLGQLKMMESINARVRRYHDEHPADEGDTASLREQSVSLGQRGDVLVVQGQLAEALKAYRDSLAIAERLAKHDPDNTQRQRDLSVSYDRVGDALVVQGQLAEALKAYRDSLAIAERLAKHDPDNTQRQRDLSVSYDKVGNVLVRQGQLAEALKAYRDSLAIREGLAKHDPDNTEWQRDLSVSYEKVGNVLVEHGQLVEALKAYRDSLAIAEGLAKHDPDNTEWQRDLSVSYNKVGDVLVRQGQLAEALKAYRDSLTIRERLAKHDPDNTEWQRDLSISYEKVGDVLVRQGQLAEALKAYRDALPIVERLAKHDPYNTQWQRDLSVSYEKVGNMHMKENQWPEALAAYERSLPIAEKLAALDPTNATWKKDLELTRATLARIRAAAESAAKPK